MNAKAATAKTAAAAATAVEATPCMCSKYEIVLREFDTPNGPDYDAESTGCIETTGNEFAPGHDAKLKSLLIRAGVAGQAIRYGSITTTAEKAAQGFGFAHMVEAGIEKGKAKAAAKAERKATRKSAAPRKSTKGAAPAASTRDHIVAAVAQAATGGTVEESPATELRAATVKIGRWEYSALIDEAGDAHYVTAKGANAVAVRGTFKDVS